MYKCTCEKDISGRAKTCPNCGEPVPVAVRIQHETPGEVSGYNYGLVSLVLGLCPILVGFPILSHLNDMGQLVVITVLCMGIISSVTCAIVGLCGARRKMGSIFGLLFAICSAGGLLVGVIQLHPSANGNLNDHAGNMVEETTPPSTEHACLSQCNERCHIIYGDAVQANLKNICQESCVHACTVNE